MKCRIQRAEKNALLTCKMVSRWRQWMTTITIMVAASVQEVWEQKWNIYLCTFYLKTEGGGGQWNPSSYEVYFEIRGRPNSFPELYSPLPEMTRKHSPPECSCPSYFIKCQRGQDNLECPWTAWRSKWQSSGHSEEYFCEGSKISHCL